MRTRTCKWVLVAILGTIFVAPLPAQGPPPVQGTLALKGTVTKFYRALNTLVVTTTDGAKHVYHFTAGLLIHGSKGTRPNDLAQLRPGTSVIVHYRINGTEELAEEIDSLVDRGVKIAEGTVTRVDRGRREITLRFADGTTDTLRLTARAASELDETLGDDGATQVTVYYTDESGYRLAHYFTKKP
jgi:hypothetical protein